MLGARFNEPGAPVSTARVFGICSDGDMMEGISGEAGSLAGHLGLDNLVFFYDDNKITIDGKTDLAFSRGRRQALRGLRLVRAAHRRPRPRRRSARRSTAPSPSRRAPRSSSRARTSASARPSRTARRRTASRSAPKDVKATKEKLGWPLEPTFFVPDEVRALFAERAEDGKKEHAAWKKIVEALLKKAAATRPSSTRSS